MRLAITLKTMETTVKPSCGNCIYFRGQPWRSFADKAGATIVPGACHRFPPQVVIRPADMDNPDSYDEIKALFPNVLPFQECGEFDGGVPPLGSALDD